MNQGKLEVVKQDMARVKIDILGVSKLKWTGIGELNSDDHYIYYCGQESLKRNELVIIESKMQSEMSEMQSNKRVQKVQNAVFGCNLKNDRRISVCF